MCWLRALSSLLFIIRINRSDCVRFRLTSELDTEFFKELDIHGRKHDRGVYLAALQLWKLLHCELCGRIGCRGDGERDQDLINVKPRILAPKILGLDFLDWLDSGREIT